jgi:hypothetical protein
VQFRNQLKDTKTLSSFSCDENISTDEAKIPQYSKTGRKKEGWGESKRF